MPKKTLELLIEAGNDYLVCVKANQKRLYQGIEQRWQQDKPCSTYSYTQCTHGRLVHRRVQIYRPMPPVVEQWAGLRSLVVVERSGNRSGKPFKEHQFYISSLAMSARGFAQVVQGHWSIENRLHWVKDVSLNEDKAPYTHLRAAANWSLVRNFFIAVSRHLGFGSIATAKRGLANQFDRLFLLLQ